MCLHAKIQFWNASQMLEGQNPQHKELLPNKARLFRSCKSISIGQQDIHLQQTPNKTVRMGIQAFLGQMQVQ